MQIKKVEHLDGLHRALSVEASSWEDFSKKVEEKLTELQGTVKLNGFRTGKVPAGVIRQRFGKAVEQEILNDLIQKTLSQALKEAQLEPATTPELVNFTMEQGQPIEYQITFESIPEIQMVTFANEQLSVPVVKISSEDIDKALESLQVQRTSWEEVTNRKTQDKDQLTIDFEGSIDGVLFQGGKAEDFALVLGEGRMIPGFEEGLKGLALGAEVDLPVTFPSNYQAAELAGKPAIFKIKIKKISSPVLPELNDDFAKTWGIEEGGMETLRKEIEMGLEREAHHLAHEQKRDLVFDKLLELNSFDIPESLVEQHLDKMEDYFKERSKGASTFSRESFRETAREFVARGLLVKQIIKTYDLQPDPEKVMEQVRRQASAYEHPEQMLGHMMNNKNFIEAMQAEALESQVIDKMLETAMIVEVESSYSELLKAKEASSRDSEGHVHDEHCEH